MRKGLKTPRTYEEAKTRIKNALFQIRATRFIADYDLFDSQTAYRVPKKSLLPWSVASELQADHDRKRRVLSERVSRIYRRSKKISLVCDLLRHSPIFLQDEWINELFLDLKKMAMHDPTPKGREAALADLTDLSRALLSIRVPSGKWRRAVKWRYISADRPQRSLVQEVTLLGRYSQYLEIATCLKAVRTLKSADQSRGPQSSRQPVPFETYASDLGVELSWLQGCWPGSAKPYLWARDRMADDLRISRPYVQRRLAQAREIVGQHLSAIRLVQDAGGRLSQERSKKAIAREKRGESGIHRKY